MKRAIYDPYDHRHGSAAWQLADAVNLAPALLMLAAALLLPHSAHASENNCVRIQNDLDRLACYDKAAGRTPRVERIAASAGVWEVHKATSKLTDQTNVSLWVDSDEPVDCRWRRGTKISLVVKCAEDKTTLYFATGCHMTDSRHNNYGNITYRLDKEKAQTVQGTASTNSRALGLWGGGAIQLAKKMFGKSQMVVRMTPYGQSPFIATFKIAGLEQAIKPLRAACNW